MRARSQDARRGGADAGRFDADREQIPGHHVILGLQMHGAEFGFVRQAPQQRAVVHDRGHLFQAFAELQAVDGGGNGPARAEQLAPLHPLFKRRVLFEIPRVHLRYAARQPDEDYRIGLGPQTLARLRTAALAARAAAAVVCKNCRRLSMLFDVLKLRAAGQRPEHVVQAITERFGLLPETPCRGVFRRAWRGG